MNNFTLDVKKNKTIYLYYLLLYVTCLSWTNTAMIAPPTALRVSITFAVLAPLVKYFWMTPAIIIAFVGLRFNSVAPFGYLPQSWDNYGFLILVIALLHATIYGNKKVFKFTRLQISIFVFVFTIQLINLQLYSPILLFILLLYVLYNSIGTKVSLNLAMFSFVILSITLSIYYFVFAKEFMQVLYGFDSERATWVDPNYFGLVLGCGIILSSAFIYQSINVKLSILYKSIFIICIVLGFIVIALQASRGAMLAVVAAFVIQIMFSNTKLYTKVLLILVTLVLVVYLYQSDYFTLLIDRVVNDEGTGSGRSDIWRRKISDWSNDFFNIFGSGYLASFYKFDPVKSDCHNEFISILLNYGILGLIIVIASIFKLCIIKRNRAFVISVVLFVSVSFMTLSPISCVVGWTSVPFLLLLLYKFIALSKLESLKK